MAHFDTLIRHDTLIHSYAGSEPTKIIYGGQAHVYKNNR
jgi:hypothetical protein